MTAVLCTTTDNIRAAIGVSPREVADNVIADLNVADQLSIYLEQVYPGYTGLAAAIADNSASADQLSAWRSVRLLCQYAGAAIVLQAGQYLLFQSITDGGTTQARFSKDDLDTTLSRVIGLREYYLGLLTQAEPIISYQVSPVLAVTPCYDPVTG